jgi:hypothetical protein
MDLSSIGAVTLVLLATSRTERPNRWGVGKDSILVEWKFERGCQCSVDADCIRVCGPRRAPRLCFQLSEYR